MSLDALATAISSRMFYPLSVLCFAIADTCIPLASYAHSLHESLNFEFGPGTSEKLAYRSAEGGAHICSRDEFDSQGHLA